MKLRYVTRSLSILAAFFASPTNSQESHDVEQELMSEAFSAVQSTGGPGSKIFISECAFIVELRPQTPCQFGSTAKVKRTVVDLAEVTEIELRPFEEKMVITFNLDVPEPNSLLTWAEAQFLGRDESFERFVERSDLLLIQTELSSATEFEYCDGTVNTLKERQHSVFIDEKPSIWPNFERLLVSCRAGQPVDPTE